MEEFGSYDWYCKLDDPFYRFMTSAINHADMDNIRRLKKAVPNMIAAWDMGSRAHRPEEVVELDINDNVEYLEREPPKELNCTPGSFNWYRCRSGHFVTYMSKAIMHADGDMRQKIGEAFPQMVAAFLMDDWDMWPKGFDSPSYNSLPSETG